MLEELIPFRKQVEAVSEQEVGKTLVFLDGNRLSCRMIECNLGNMITDAYVDLVCRNLTINSLEVTSVTNRYYYYVPLFIPVYQICHRRPMG